MPVRDDGSGNLFAWLGEPPAGYPGGDPAGEGAVLAGDPAGEGAVLTGGRLDAVDATGQHRPLGVVAGFLALDALRAAGAVPRRPVGVAAFTAAPGAPPAGADRRLPDHIHAFIELRPEPARVLSELDTPVGLAGGVQPHGRWRLDFTGGGGATPGDPMLTYAFTVLAANKEARRREAYATVGRVRVEPNATDTVASLVRGWLDVRAADETTLDTLVEAVVTKARDRAARDGTALHVAEEARGGAVEFDRALLARLGPVVARQTRVRVPVLPADAGVLAGPVPTAVILVRDRGGVVTEADRAAGVAALAGALRELACG